MTGLTTSRWLRAAISGMTPPYSAWMSICELTTLESNRSPFSITAAAVSSQLDSIPKIFTPLIIHLIAYLKKMLK